MSYNKAIITLKDGDVIELEGDFEGEFETPFLDPSFISLGSENERILIRSDQLTCIRLVKTKKIKGQAITINVAGTLSPKEMADEIRKQINNCL